MLVLGGGPAGGGPIGNGGGGGITKGSPLLSLPPTLSCDTFLGLGFFGGGGFRPILRMFDYYSCC